MNKKYHSWFMILEFSITNKIEKIRQKKILRWITTAHSKASLPRLKRRRPYLVMVKNEFCMNSTTVGYYNGLYVTVLCAAHFLSEISYAAAVWDAWPGGWTVHLCNEMRWDYLKLSTNTNKQQITNVFVPHIDNLPMRIRIN